MTPLDDYVRTLSYDRRNVVDAADFGYCTTKLIALPVNVVSHAWMRGIEEPWLSRLHGRTFALLYEERLAQEDIVEVTLIDPDDDPYEHFQTATLPYVYA